jgi:hypothetical protein
MLDIAKNISNTTLALHCYMDQVGVAVPDMSEIVASIIFSEVSLTLFSRYTLRDSCDRTLTYELRLAGYTLSKMSLRRRMKLRMSRNIASVMLILFVS